MINQFVAENTQANLNFNIELQKDKRVYCFIGENGVGKTQLLESMAKSFLYCHSLLNNKENYHKSLYVKDGISEKLNGKKLYLPLGIKINENIVTQVIVINDEDCGGGIFPESDVIGNEFTQGFDEQRSQIRNDGNINNWW